MFVYSCVRVFVCSANVVLHIVRSIDPLTDSLLVSKWVRWIWFKICLDTNLFVSTVS